MTTRATETAGPAGTTAGRATGWQLLEQVLCGATLALLGWRGIFHYQTSYGVLLGLALAPIWLGRLRRFSGGVVFALAGLLALVGGTVLAATAGRSGRTVDSAQFLGDGGLVLVVLVGVAVMLWGRTIMSRRAVAIFFGLGLAFRQLASGLGSDNLWKFALAIPVTVIVLALTDEFRRGRWTLIALIVLGAVSATHDARSVFGTFALAVVVIVWQLRPSRMGRPASWVWTVLIGVAVAAAVYNLATSLLVDGYFGTEAQQRSQQQIAEAGSLILGGRPEIAATLALMRHDFAGFGFGVGPNVTDIAAAKTGMIAINYDPDNNYVSNYMFGGHVELHSVVGDLWARAGVLGLVFLVVLAILAARNLAFSIHRREASGLVAFFACYTGWNLFFSPQFSAVPILTLTLGLGMIALAADGRPPAGPGRRAHRPADPGERAADRRPQRAR